MIEKKIPKKVQLWILLVGSTIGLLIGGFVFIGLPYPYEFAVWFGVLVVVIGSMYALDWRYRDILEEWGITGKRKKGEQ